MNKTSSRYKFLLKNIGLLTLSQFATRLLSFFLVPLYTNILSTGEYGTYDLFVSTIGVLFPILTLNIQEAVLRFSMEKEIDNKALVTISVRYLFIGNIVVIVGLIVNRVFSFSETTSKYAVYFFLMYFIQTVLGVLTSYIRGTGKIKELSISSVITAIITIGCNILFLLIFKMGLVGYFIANIIGPLVQIAYLALVSCFFCYLSTEKYSNEKKEMITYSKPLIVNSIAWWINNLSDRYVVTFFCGLAENGIYSIAGKIPQILNIFQTIFNQAWTLSAVKEYDPKDKNGFFSNTYNAYNCFLITMCSMIILIDKYLAKLLYAKDFYMAWKYVPWLTMAILFGALSGYLGGFFSATKNSKVFAISTVWGAVVNIALNLIFTPFYGAIAASIATFISYFIVWWYRYYQSKKYIELKVNILRDLVAYFVLLLQSIMLLIFEGIVLLCLELILHIVVYVLYFGEWRGLVMEMCERLRNVNEREKL